MNADEPDGRLLKQRVRRRRARDAKIGDKIADFVESRGSMDLAREIRAKFGTTFPVEAQISVIGAAVTGIASASEIVRV